MASHRIVTILAVSVVLAIGVSSTGLIAHTRFMCNGRTVEIPWQLRLCAFDDNFGKLGIYYMGEFMPVKEKITVGGIMDAIETSLKKIIHRYSDSRIYLRIVPLDHLIALKLSKNELELFTSIEDQQVKIVENFMLAREYIQPGVSTADVWHSTARHAIQMHHNNPLFKVEVGGGEIRPKNESKDGRIFYRIIYVDRIGAQQVLVFSDTNSFPPEFQSLEKATKETCLEFGYNEYSDIVRCLDMNVFLELVRAFNSAN